MKQIWTFFIAGLFSVAVASILIQNTRAEGEKNSSGDPRVNKIKDSETTALKTTVPGSADMEAALVRKQAETLEHEERIKIAEERLKSEEERIKYKIEELEALQADIDANDAKKKKYSETVFKKLVKTYETMTPKKAAAVISASDDGLAVELMLQMKEKKVAAILDVMEPARATALSTLMANRKPAAEAKGEAKVKP